MLKINCVHNHWDPHHWMEPGIGIMTCDGGRIVSREELIQIVNALV